MLLLKNAILKKSPKLGLSAAQYYTTDLSAIAQTHRALMRLKMQGVDLSDFVVQISDDMDAGGLVRPSFSFGDDKVVLIQLNSEATTLYSNHSRPQKSSNNSDRTIWHEFGHGLHSLMNPNSFERFSKMPLNEQKEYLKQFNLTLNEVAELVSIYPTRSHQLLIELVAEMYSAEQAGRIIKDERLWQLYDHLGGPTIPRRQALSQSITQTTVVTSSQNGDINPPNSRDTKEFDPAVVSVKSLDLSSGHFYKVEKVDWKGKT
jgi:hypothetical protein